MRYSFNVNDIVYVKLTDTGRAYLKHQHKMLFEGVLDRPEYRPRHEFNGFSRWQLWDLMSTFGEHVGMGIELMFETTIEIDEKDLKGLAE